MRKNNYSYLHLFLFLGLVLVDQAVKLFLTRYYHSALSSNSGGAFGVGGGLDFYSAVTLLVLVLIFVIYFFSDYRYRSPLILIMAGGFSNQIDRIFKNGVIDYIDLKFWPSFNLADSLIFAGVCLVILKLFRDSRST